MQKVITSLGLIFIGALIMGGVMWMMAPKLMVHEFQSPYDVDKTVEVIAENAKKQGWVVKNVVDMQKSMKKKLKKDILPTKVMKLGQTQYAYELLKEDDTHFVAAMMPHSIAIYQKSDGHAYISSMNMGLMGKIFGGETDRIMDKVQKDDDVILKFLMDQ
ncbi:MAG: DUF302 domain-containing protein [Campylobacterota bacterium]|nr:DUF302 domain-containing protein [Campylobacterota bacterium]